MEEQNQPQDEAQSQEQQAVAAVMALEGQHASGANWFFWIAGLSIVNSIILFTGGDVSFIIGLGITQIVDAVGQLALEEGLTSGPLVALIVDVIIALIFVLFGFFARRGKNVSFIVGMVLYFLDGLLFLPVQDWLSIGFHGFALWCIYGGLQANKELQKLDQMQEQSTMGTIG